MATQGWFETVLRTLLSQGDIYNELPFSSPVLPLAHLSKGTGKKGAVIWTETDFGSPRPQNQPNHALFAYRVAHGIVVSHDCAIDKPARTSRILFAPVAPLTVFDTATQETIRQQAHLAAMLLPDVPGIGDSYVDLKAITPFPAELVLQRTKIASMTDQARDRLQQALVAFLVYRQKPPDPRT